MQQHDDVGIDVDVGGGEYIPQVSRSSVVLNLEMNALAALLLLPFTS